ncbi:MAG: hypothetical protein ACI4MN_02125 [Candidatus Coproplasma sp.]
MSEREKYIKKFLTDTIALGAMYILPDGRMLDLSLLENGHSDFFAITGLSAEDLKKQGWIRLNTKVGYIELPFGQITKEQELALSKIKEIMGIG